MTSRRGLYRGSVLAFALAGLAGCLYTWDIPSRPTQVGRDAVGAGGDGGVVTKACDHEFVVPSPLLMNSKTQDMARNCAVTANQFIQKSLGNNSWSIVFGTIQVVGAGTGTVATAAAFSNGKNDSTSAKIGAVSFAAAAAFAAFDKAYAPGDRTANESGVALKVGQLILNATAQAAAGDSEAARKTLAACQDPSYADVALRQVDLSQLQALYAQLLSRMSSRTGGAGGAAGSSGAAGSTGSST